MISTKTKEDIAIAVTVMSLAVSVLGGAVYAVSKAPEAMSNFVQQMTMQEANERESRETAISDVFGIDRDRFIVTYDGGGRYKVLFDGSAYLVEFEKQENGSMRVTKRVMLEEQDD